MPPQQRLQSPETVVSCVGKGDGHTAPETDTVCFTIRISPPILRRAQHIMLRMEGGGIEKHEGCEATCCIKVGLTSLTSK